MVCLAPNHVNVKTAELIKLLRTLIDFILRGDADGAALVAKWAAGEFRKLTA